MSSVALGEVWYLRPIPGLTCLTQLEEGGNLQESAFFENGCGAKNFGNKPLFLELENLGGGDH